MCYLDQVRTSQLLSCKQIENSAWNSYLCHWSSPGLNTEGERSHAHHTLPIWKSPTLHGPVICWTLNKIWSSSLEVQCKFTSLRFCDCKCHNINTVFTEWDRRSSVSFSASCLSCFATTADTCLLDSLLFFFARCAKRRLSFRNVLYSLLSFRLFNSLFASSNEALAFFPGEEFDKIMTRRLTRGGAMETGRRVATGRMEATESMSRGVGWGGAL